MSVNNFIPTVWSAKLLKQLDESHVCVNVCTREYEGEIKQKGDTVKINSIGDISISSYTKNSTSLSIETLEDASTHLTIDQAKYFAFEVDDIDAVQSNVNYMPRAIEKAGVALSDTADAVVAQLYSEAGITESDATFDQDTVFDVVATIREDMLVANVPANARIFWIIGPKAYSEVLEGKIETLTDNVTEIENGMVGRLYGLDIYVSNNLQNDNTASDPTYRSLAGTYDSIAYAEQIRSVEAYRPESSFSDAVKGLHLYGAKVIRPDQLIDYTLNLA